MGAYFARGMAYIINLNAVPIENAFYKSLGTDADRSFRFYPSHMCIFMPLSARCCCWWPSI